MFEEIEQRFRKIAPLVDFCSLRVVRERSERLYIRQGVVQPLQLLDDFGAMVTVMDAGGLGYAATSDLSMSGLKTAAERAVEWARRSAGRMLFDPSKLAMPAPSGAFQEQAARPWNQTSLRDKIELAMDLSAQLNTADEIVDWDVLLWGKEREQLYLTTDGARVTQAFPILIPGMSVTANAGGETVRRCFGGFDLGRQGGLEMLDQVRFTEQAEILTREALELLRAPNCPTGTMDLLLDSDQMYLQLHESIGHPLEMDRILGDERNYAGTSFVSLDMLGSYQYGSKLLNVTFDPTVSGEFASYSFDDDGALAERQFLIKDGILERLLGGTISQARSGMPGVSNSRACSWNRPPIDRMGNVNLEPGDASFEDMVRSIEHGVFMKRNCSWSIDDSRNKFQFGCEYGRMIRGGELAEVVKKPSYKGISATFWRSLKAVGNKDTWTLLGTPFCGKGEPNQAIWVGHAVPSCLFSGVEVFGGE